MKIGFIGLGNMGGPMASQLAASGYHVVGYDLADISVADVQMVQTVSEAVTGADVVFTMLPDGASVLKVVPDILQALSPDSVYVDCSTIDMDSVAAVAKQVEAQGGLFLDAPVSGGTVGAASGTLTFMVGGTQTGFHRCQPLFESMGQKTVYCGGAGSGQAAKICNNMILGVTMIATCEAFVLADKLGLNRQKLFDVVSTSSGHSWSMNTYCPAPGVGPGSPADHGYQPGFSSDLMLKDLRLGQDAAVSVDVDTPMGAHARDLYARFVEKDGGDGRDFSAILPWLENRRRS